MSRLSPKNANYQSFPSFFNRDTFMIQMSRFPNYHAYLDFKSCHFFQKNVTFYSKNVTISEDPQHLKKFIQAAEVYSKLSKMSRLSQKNANYQLFPSIFNRDTFLIQMSRYPNYQPYLDFSIVTLFSKKCHILLPKCHNF